jgi:hypothetical protein
MVRPLDIQYERYFCNFQVSAKNEQSPIGRKFAQSGHPACLPKRMYPRLSKEKRIHKKNLRKYLSSHGTSSDVIF